MNKEHLSFQDIHEAYRAKILRYLSKLVNETESEDLCQEVFIKVDRGLKNFRGDSSLSTWIYRIATNVAMDKLRSFSSRQKTMEKSLDTLSELNNQSFEDKNVWKEDKEPSVDQQMVRDEMSSCVRGYIEELPDDYRTVIILSEIEELKNQEIADILGLSLDNVKIRLHRGKAKLKDVLDKSCDFYHNEQNVLSCDQKAAKAN